MIATVLLALLPQTPATPAQEPAKDAPSAPAAQDTTPQTLEAEGWRPVSGVSLIVNEECITPRDIQRTAQRLGVPVSTREERQELFQKITSELVRAMLEEQAGKDLGFDPKLVDRLVRDELERNVERAGSVSRLAERLKQEDLDSFTYRDDATTRIYRQLWEGSIDGTYPGPGGRAYADRYVRPGRLAFEHRREGENAKIDEEVVLQQLVVDPRRVDLDLEGARELAIDLRRRVGEGEDIGELAESYKGAEPGTKGILRALPVKKLSEVAPDLGRFLSTASIGDISEVIPSETDGVVRAYYFVKLLERHGGGAADFKDPAYQAELADRISHALSTYRKESELRRLLGAAYVWPPEAFGRAQNP